MLTYEVYTADDLIKLVKEGTILPEKTHTGSDELTEEEVATYIPFQRAGRAQKMLDLGCGPGLNGIAIVSNHPTMRGISFDRPGTVAVAEKSIQKYDMENGMEILRGDYARDPIGGEYDLILACDTLSYTKEEIDHIMRKLYNSLNPGGVLISIYHSLTDNRTKPEELVLGMMFSGLEGEDMGLLDQGFITDAVIRDGFRSVRS